MENYRITIDDESIGNRIMENYRRIMAKKNIEGEINRGYMRYPFHLKREIVIGPHRKTILVPDVPKYGPGPERYHPLLYKYHLPSYKIIKIPSGLIKKLNKHN